MSSRAFSVSYPRRTADSKLARTTWPEVLRPRAIMRPRDWARQRALLRILRKSFFHTNWNFISLEYFFDFSASFMANFPNFQLFKRFRYTFLTLKVVCTWGRGLLSLASGVKRWLRRQYFRISQPGLRWVPYISFCRGGSRIFFRRGCTLLLLYFNTNKPHSFFFFFQNTSCIRKPQVISGEGGGRTPCTLSLDPLLFCALCLRLTLICLQAPGKLGLKKIQSYWHYDTVNFCL